jgi:NCAIR mutase (PurE)-related protein
MNLRQILKQVAQGAISPAAAAHHIDATREKNLGFARVDTDRLRRRGFPEVIFSQGKTPDHVVKIMAALAESGQNVLATRATPAQYEAVHRAFPKAVFHETARIIALDVKPLAPATGLVAVLCAGTTDIPVAEEAAIVAEKMGARVRRVFDVGVAGLHRLIHHLPDLQKARVLIVVAGMEGALPSVVGGMTQCPIIAVPTSVGYGTSMQGTAALLAMLNTCVPGITVVNIDNGFGAGVAAAMINRLPEQHRKSTRKRTSR